MEDIFAVSDARPSAVDVVVDKIKELLIDRKLSPGEMIPSESVLAESLKVGRGTVREALKILSAYGVIEIRRGAGTYISSASNKRLFDASLFQILVQEQDYTSLTQVRQILEEGIVRLVIQFASVEEMGRLNDALQQFLDALAAEDHDPVQAGRLDIAYHRLLGKYSHNTIIENIYNFVIELFAPTINPFHAGVYEEHKLLQQAIAQRDVQEALVHVRNHTRVWMSSHASDGFDASAAAGGAAVPATSLQ